MEGVNVFFRGIGGGLREGAAARTSFFRAVPVLKSKDTKGTDTKPRPDVLQAAVLFVRNATGRICHGHTKAPTRFEA